MVSKKYFFTTIISLSIFTFGILLIGLSFFLQNQIGKWENVFMAIGCGFVPGGLISLIIQVFISNELKKELKINIEDCFHLKYKEVYNIIESGICKYYDSFPTDYVKNQIFDSTKEIKIFNTWLPDVTSLQPSIKNAIKNGSKISVIILDPESPLTEYRAKQVGFDKEEVHKRIKSTIKDFTPLIKKVNLNNNISISTIDELFSFSFYLIDDIILIGFYWANKHNLQGTYIQLLNNPKSKLCNDLLENFEEQQKRSQKIEI